MALGQVIVKIHDLIMDGSMSFWIRRLLIAVSLTSTLLLKAQSQSAWIECEGRYGGHLQGVVSDEESIYWSHTVQIAKTDLQGRLIKRIDVPSHHGDLTLHNQRLYVAVELGSFNQAPGATDSWVYVYDTGTLKLLTKHPVPELVHGAGGIAFHDERFILVGGLPATHEQNYAFEYDTQFNFIKRHVLFSGQTRLGIQTASFMDGYWWFGCYGSPKNPGLLKADQNFALVGQAKTDFSYGIGLLNPSTVFRGDCFENNRRGKIQLLKTSAPETNPSPNRIRFAAYNVLFGIWAEPEAIGTMFKPYHLDVIGFSEVPSGDWTLRVGKQLGMPYAYVGEISSANHKDKYKSILSRTPLTEAHEIQLDASGWSPASVVGARTLIRGTEVLVYSTHIPGQAALKGSAAQTIANSVLPRASDTSPNLVLLGDLNNHIGDPPLTALEDAGMIATWLNLPINLQSLSSHQHIESGRESGVIDHIFYTKASKAQATNGGVIYNAYNPPYAKPPGERYQREWQAYGKPLSDHRPVWAELEFPIRE